MSDFEKIQYAKARLGLARMMGDASEVEKWREHVAYWESRPTTGAVDLLDSSAKSALVAQPANH